MQPVARDELLAFARDARDVHEGRDRAKIAAEIDARSRPSANGVVPQSGMDSTSTRSLRSAASASAMSSSWLNCCTYSSSGRPRYWLFTPIRSDTKP
jgi:hypothetical protein